MVDPFDERVKNWVAGVVEGASVSLSAPNGTVKPGKGVGLYLLEIAHAPLPSSLKTPPLQVFLKYLVTTWAAKPEDAHQMLVDLIFAAMQEPEFQVELESMALTVWTAFNAPPRPSFILRVPLRQERPEPATRLVRHPLKVDSSLMTAFHGVLLGPDDIPLADGRVEIPALQLWARTDYKGRFHFSGVPEGGKKRLLVRARGHELAIDNDQDYPDATAPLVIRFSSLEE